MHKRYTQSAKIFVGVTTTLIAIVISVLLMPLHAEAASDDVSIMKKTLANAISRCYSSTYIKPDLTPAGQFTTEDIFVYANRKKGDILILDDLGGKMSCQQVFLGSNKAQGLNSLFGKNPTVPANLGYTQAEGENPSSTRCMSISYKHASDSGQMVDFTSNSLCFGVMSDGMIDRNSFAEGSVFSGECADPICLAADSLGRVYIVWEDNEGLHNEWEVGYYGNLMNNGDATSWDTLYNAVSENASLLNSDQGYANPSTNQTKTDDPGAFAAYTITNYSTAAEAAFKYYTGSSNMDSQKFNQSDIDYLLDRAYLKMKNAGIITEDSTCYVGKDEALSQGTSYAHYNAGMNMWCPVFLNTGLAAGKTYNVVGNSLKDLFAASPERILEIITNRDQGYATAGDMCIDNARKRLEEFKQAWRDEYAKGDDKDPAKLQYYKEKQAVLRNMINTPGGTYKTENGQVSCLELPTIDDAPETPPDTSGGNDGGTTADTPVGGGAGVDNPPSSNGNDLTECLNNAGSLGWLLCPVLNIVKVTVEGFYDDIETNWLPIEYNYVRARDGEGIYDGWKVFRTFSNIVFVIMLLIVIFSQLTGIGLSNYGIKKMLPSLIVVAVLVNVSFLICQFLVDATNVLGAEAGQLLAGIGAKISGASANVGFGTVVKGAISTVFSFAGIGVVAGAAGVAIVSNPGLLIPILIFGLGVIISLFFLFAILAIRKAGVYVMIMLAPLAIMCYALPNTKSLFDKWKRIFTSLLLVYPICQILTGGGQMISHIMLANNNEGFTYNIVAVVLAFLPIFLIPSIIRSSMTALGNLGNRMQLFGNRLRNGATGALRRADVTQRAQTSLGNFGATHGEGLLRRVNQRLLNTRGIGRVVGGVENSRLGQAISNQRARARNQRIANYQKMMLGDDAADYLANNLDPDQRLDNALTAQQLRLRNELVEDAMQRLTTGKAEYNGTSINADDGTADGSMSQALGYYMDQYVASGGTDEGSLIWMQAIARKMIENGDTTRTHVMNKLHSRSFDQNGKAIPVDHATRALASYVNNNGQWMGKLKAEDNGSFQLVGQLAKDGVATYDQLHYNATGGDKLRGNQVGDLSDRYFDGMKAALDSGSFLTNYEAGNNLLAMDNAFRQAMSNPQTAANIKKETLDKINELHKEAYILRDLRAEQEANWAVQNGAIMASNPNWENIMKRDISQDPGKYRGTWSKNSVNMSGYQDLKLYDPTQINLNH